MIKWFRQKHLIYIHMLQNVRQREQCETFLIIILSGWNLFTITDKNLCKVDLEQTFHQKMLCRYSLFVCLFKNIKWYWPPCNNWKVKDDMFFCFEWSSKAALSNCVLPGYNHLVLLPNCTENRNLCCCPGMIKSSPCQC